MQMRVDQARHHGLAGKLDHLRARPDVADDLLFAADGEEAPVLDGETVRDAEILVDRDHLAAAQHQIGGLRESRGGEEGEETSETKQHGSLPLFGRD